MKNTGVSPAMTTRGKRIGRAAWTASCPARRGARGAKPDRRRRTLLFLFPAFVFSCSCFTLASDWPQLQCNAARTGWTPDSPAPPYGVVYSLHFQPESLGLVQPVIHNDVMYVPTRQGRLYAFNPVDGERLWVRDGFGTVVRTPACADGMVYLSNLEGMVIAANAADGAFVWITDLDFAVSAAMCEENGRLYIGNRRGEMFCLDGKSGEIAWKTRLPFYVWSAAAAADGRVYVGTDGGELRVFCLDAGTGAELWRSGKMPGRFIRDWCPVAHAGKVFINTMPSSQPLPEIGPFVPWGPPEEVTQKYADQLARREFPDDFKNAAEELAEWLGNNPDSPVDQTMFAFDAQTGGSPYVVGTYRSLAGWCSPAPPPAVDSEGMLQVTVSYRSFSFARLDPATGRYMQVFGWKGTNGDENHASSCGGDRIFWKHYGGTCPASMAYDLKTGEMLSLVVSARWLPESLYKRVSVVKDSEKENAWYRTGLHDEGSLANAYTAAAIWKDMLFHNHGEGEGGHGIVAIKGFSGGETLAEKIVRQRREREAQRRGAR